jgi:hypothetical protein
LSETVKGQSEGLTVRIKVFCALALGFTFTACAIQRSEIANDARSSMVGFPKERILACMGPPANQATVGTTEVWSYPSGNGRTDVAVFGSGGNGFYSSSGVAERRFCTVNVAMTNGMVTQVNYLGPTGGLLSPNEQCAFAVANCVAKQ